MQNFKAGKIVSPMLVSRIITINTVVAENQNKGTASYSKRSAQHFYLILTNFIFLDRSSQKPPIPNFTPICRAGSKLIYGDRRTDTTKLMRDFSQLYQPPQKESRLNMKR